MGDLLRITAFELRLAFGRISTWVYFLILLTLGFVLMASAGGAWEGFDSGGGGRLATSALEITRGVGALMLLTLPITAALFGNAVHRDFHTRMHPLFFTTPVSRGSYLGGRFAGALLVNLFILAGAGVGLAAASRSPLLMPERVGPFLPAAYLQAYGFVVLPSLVFTGALLFALAAITRQMLPNYIGGVALLVVYSMVKRRLGDLESGEVAALFDPMGMAPVTLATRYWTVAERNSRLLPFDGLFWGNRLLWLALAAVVLALLYWRFRFSHAASEGKRRRGEGEDVLAPPEPALRPAALPPSERSFGVVAQLVQYASSTRREFWRIVWSVHFVALAAIGLIATIFMATQLGELYDTTTHPVTYVVLETTTAGFALFALVILTFYAGELVWGERDQRISQLHDSTPVAPWVPFTAKLTALAGVLVVLQAMVALVGIATQLAHGYLGIDPGLYVTELFVRQLTMYVLLAVLAMAVHVVVDHKYVGHFVMILYYVVTPIVHHRLGWEHILYNVGAGGETPYSDMNGYGHSWLAWRWMNLYWAGLALLLAVASHLLWVRGEERGAAWRMRLARLRLSRPVRVLGGFACLLFVFTGGFVFYNTNVLNEYHSSRAVERMQAEYEKRYSRFEGAPQPRIVGVEVDLAIHPRERDLEAKGVFRLVNRTAGDIDSVHVNYPADATRRSFTFDREAEPEVKDDEYGYHIYRLRTPLAPGDSLRLAWEVDYRTQGFENSVSHGGTVHNGTFVSNHLFPSIGYSTLGELRDDDARRRHGLAPKDAEPPPDDPAGLRNPDISTDADWIDFAATVSTDEDQIALAPGYLVREWTEGGRRYFRYDAEVPTLNFYAFLSARYAVRKDRWRDVALEIYHHPGHEYNLDRMLSAAKKSLEYYTASFGPYPHRQLRIVEFPRYQVFAQSFPNTVPFSEGIGFIAKVDPEDVDYVFHVTAHEVAHQWWGHQVVGGSVQGSALLSESLSEYSALMVMEKEYGFEGVKKFLRYELEGYLTGRAQERRKEVPLVRMAAHQTYLRYNKGALALYALRDYIGEERLNAALRGYLQAERYRGPPYTSSLDLVRHLRAATPDSLRYVVDDLFEHVTLYENRTEGATARRTDEGRYVVEVDIRARKVRADSLGNETDIPMADWVDVGVFGRAEGISSSKDLGPPLYLRKHRLSPGRQTVRVEVDARPERAGVDPYHRLIDRQMSDNTVAVKPLPPARQAASPVAGSGSGPGVAERGQPDGSR